MLLVRNNVNGGASAIISGWADGSVSLGNTGYPADHGLSLAYNMHMNDQQIYFRSGTGSQPRSGLQWAFGHL